MKELKYPLAFIFLFKMMLNISAQKIAGGAAHSLAICADSTVKSWGYNWTGQLGNGNNINSNIPIQVNSLNQIVAVSGGIAHSMALKKDGTVWTWGDNIYGDLGVGHNAQLNIPVKVSSLSGIIAISAGEYFSLALKNDGTVWAWGYNTFGSLGNGTNNSTNVPVQVNSLTNIIAISASGRHALALRNDSTIWSWGWNVFGQLGDGTYNDSNTPVQVNGITNAYAIAAGAYHSMALRPVATVWTWGSNVYGELGNAVGSMTSTPSSVGSIINPLVGNVKIVAGYDHSFAIKYNGRLRGWGNDSYGEIGNGTNGGALFYPTQVTSFTSNANFVAVGQQHSLILKNDGTLWSTGGNWAGQLGIGNNIDTLVPVQINGICSMLSGVSEIQNTNSFNVNIYPNPNNGAFNFNIENATGSYELLIINTIGQVVHSQHVSQGKNDINLGHFSAGLYNCVLLDNSQKIYSVKLLIQ